jgi:hypothetical protein
MSHSQIRLAAHILPLSRATTFAAAKHEWTLLSVEVSEEFDECPCGHEIKEHCYIRNRITGSETYVGNVCIKNFMGIDTGNLFSGIRRISDDHSANANSEVIEYARTQGFLFPGEYEFLLSTRRKRNLSPAQLSWKRKINARILNKVVVARRGRG